MFGFFIVISMVIFGGLIAFLGDRVGMKVGKKRLSMFGLRPKYTSMIITVLTGFLIAGATLLVLTLMSEYVRTAIFELRNIQKELVLTSAKVEHLTEQVTQKETEYKGLTAKYLELQNNLTQVTWQRKRVEQQLDLTTVQFEKATQTLLDVQSNLSSTKGELDLAQNRLQNLTKLNQDLKEQITNLNLQESRLNQQIQNLEGWLITLEDRNKTIVNRPMIFYVGEILIAKVIDPGTTADKAFGAIIEPLLKEANESALKRGARIPGKSQYALRIAPRRVAEVCAQLANLKSKAVLRIVVEKNSVLDEPVTVTLELYPNTLIFKSGESIVATELSGGISESGLRDQLLGMLIIANNKAIEKGIITDGQNLRNIISVSEIAKLITLIRENKEGQMKVSLVALNDIYRVDQFKVQFQLTKN